MKKRMILNLFLAAACLTGCQSASSPTAASTSASAVETTSDAASEEASIISSDSSASKTAATVSSESSASEEAVYQTITPEEAMQQQSEGKNPIFLDVRQPSEYEAGHIPGALLLPDDKLPDQAEEMLPDKDALIFVYCRSGRRSKGAANALLQLGYRNVWDLGGILDWPYDTEA